MHPLRRIIIYLAGLAVLSFGVVLNTKTGYGVAPVNCVPYSISEITGRSLGFITALIYLIFVAAQIFIMGKRFTPLVFLQVPLSILFGYYTNLFNKSIQVGELKTPFRIFLLVAAIFFTSLGVVITIRMKIVPNAPDALIAQIAESTNKNFGFIKNLFDISCVVLTLMICFIAGRGIIGIGAGTLVAVVLTGRTIHAINKVWDRKFGRSKKE